MPSGRLRNAVAILTLLIAALYNTAVADWEIQHSLLPLPKSYMPAVYTEERLGDVSLNAIWVSGDGIVFAVGECGAILVGNDAGWQDMNTDPYISFNAVWGTSSDNVYAVGYSHEKGIIYHYNGSRWREMESATYQPLSSIWGAAADDLFAAGDNGAIVHFNGTVWSPMASGTDENLLYIHGTSATDILAVSRMGTVLHYEGLGWRQVTSYRENNGLAMDNAWGDTKENILANASGTLLQYDGRNWTELPSDTLFEHVTGVWGYGETFWVAGIDTDSHYLLAEYKGGAWHPISGWGPDSRPRSVWFSSEETVWVLSSTGDMDDQILQYDGAIWEEHGTETPGAILNAVWGKGPANVIAVGENGMIRHYDGQSWHAETAPVAVDLLDVWAGPETTFFAVGKNGTVLQRTADAEWASVASGTEANLNAVRGDSLGQVYMVGDSGTILLWDGQRCAPLQSGTDQDLTGIWISENDTPYVAGKGAVLRTYHSGAWSPFIVPEDTLDMISIWGSSENDIWAVVSINDTEVQIFHYEGNTWAIDYHVYGNRIRGTEGGELFSISRGGSELSWYHGGSWSRRVPLDGMGLYDIWATDTDCFIVGDNGRVLHQALPDTTPPKVLSVRPAPGSTDFPAGGITGRIVIRFSEPVAGGTLPISIQDAAGNSLASVPGSFLTGSAVVMGWPVSLDSSTTYTVTVPAATRDFAGNPMTTDYSWSFTTETAEETGAGGTWITDELWMRAKINTGDKGEIEGRWLQGGADTTARGDQVIWGYFYADPMDVSWGNRENPDLFVKIWFDKSGSLYISYFHVSVPEIKVWSSFPGTTLMDSLACFRGNTATLSHRHVGHFYYYQPESGTYLYNTSYQFENGEAPDGYTQSTIPGGYDLAENGLRIGAIIQTENMGPIEGIWRQGGQATTERGDKVLWGYFYADPAIMNWGSAENPDLFVKAWYDVSGAVFLNFFHVSVPDIDVFSEMPVTGIYNNQGTTTLGNRFIEHRYQIGGNGVKP